MHQCRGQDKYDAIVEAGLGVEYSPPGPLFMIYNTVTVTVTLYIGSSNCPCPEGCTTTNHSLLVVK